MNTERNNSPAIRWGFLIFIAVLGSINALLTYQFGTTFLVSAFGRDGGMLASYAAGIYALIIFDVAFVCWFWVYRRLAESKEQRAIALIMSIAALTGSILATIVQLANGAFGLVDLSAYMNTIGFVAMAGMIAITAGHIVSISVFALTSPEEKTIQTAVKLKSQALQLALSEASNRVNRDMSVVGDILASEVRADVLRHLGFDEAANRIASAEVPALPAGNDSTHELQPAPAMTQGSDAPASSPFRVRSDGGSSNSPRDGGNNGTNYLS
jgi:hypothetical protein